MSLNQEKKSKPSKLTTPLEDDAEDIDEETGYNSTNRASSSLYNTLYGLFNWRKSCNNNNNTNSDTEENQPKCYPCACFNFTWLVCASIFCSKHPSPKLMMALSCVCFLLSLASFIAGGIYASDYETHVTYQWHTPIGLILIVIAFIFSVGYTYSLGNDSEPGGYLLSDDEESRRECQHNAQLTAAIFLAGTGLLLLLFECMYFWFAPPKGHQQPTSTLPAGLILISGFFMCSSLYLRFFSAVCRAYELHHQQTSANFF